MADAGPGPNAEAILAPPALILASASPRRRELLRRLDVAFTVRSADVDETPRPGEDPAVYVRRLAEAKASAAAAEPSGPGEIVLGADTTVTLDGHILGKPADETEAAATLTTLSGRTHLVLTGVAVAADGRLTSSVVTTEVTFRRLSVAEIDAYVATGEPFDKAGAYALQGEGGGLVAEVRGSASNVVGLPMAQTAALLSAAGLDLVAWGPPR